ncbi:hypothetical protein [Nocardioides limicola]|uniref:hypothetical protein n=1 Tax=Nocardioides limicola TaxID=2803368 RepID=UPI00193B08D5|nr:hypothetical protein [Nocardioides sp. DJM-14]
MRHLAAAALAAALVLTGCSDSDAVDSAADEPVAESPTTPDSPAPAEETEPEAEPEPEAGAPEKVELSEAFEDEELGHSFTITGLVRNFPVPDNFTSLRESGELVLVEVDVTAGSEFSGGVQGGFKITSPDGTANSATTIAADAMEAAGFTPFTGVSRGESGIGWIAFQVNTKADTYTLNYERREASVIGQDRVIPAKVWEFPLPA